MITAVDTNVLLDVFGADPKFGERSREALRTCLSEGSIVATGVVWAEMAGAFTSVEEMLAATTTLGVTFSALSQDAALIAGSRWRTYRAGGGSRQRLVADFLVGAHALAQADRLLTRDRGFYRSYFADLGVVDPAA